MRVDAFAMSDVAAPLGWTLVHSLWEAFFVWIVLRLGVRRIPRPDVRSTLGLLGLAVFALMQLATFAACLQGATAAPWSTSASLLLTTRETFLPIQSPAEGWFGTAVRHVDPWMPWIVVAWSLGSVYKLLVCARDVHRTQRLLEQADPLPEPLLGRLHALAERIGVRGLAIRFVAATVTAGPGTVGWLRPFIFVPPALLMALSPAEVEAIVAHELAHVLRRDYLLAAILFVFEGAYTCNPFVRWIVVLLNDDAEMACDRIAVRHVTDPTIYVHALKCAAEEVIAANRLIMAATGGSLVARVGSILKPPAPERSRSAWTTVGVAGASVAILLAISTSAIASASATRSEARFLAAHTLHQAVDKITAYDGDLAAVDAAVAGCLGHAVSGDVERSLELLARAGSTSSRPISPPQFRAAFATVDEIVARSTDPATTARLERFLLHALGADDRPFSNLRLRTLLYSPEAYRRLNVSAQNQRRLFNAERYENDRFGRVSDAMQHLADVLKSPEWLDRTRDDLAQMHPQQADLSITARTANDSVVAERFTDFLRASHDKRFSQFLAGIDEPLGTYGRTAAIGPGGVISHRRPEQWSKTEALR